MRCHPSSQFPTLHAPFGLERDVTSSTSGPAEVIEDELLALRRKGLLREERDLWTKALINANNIRKLSIHACSNDYLDLAQSVSRETSGGGNATSPSPASTPPLGSGASRLIQGTHTTHHALEAALASWLGLPTALLFSSGYAANVGTLEALGLSGGVILSDALNHGSIIDGCRLSPAKVQIYPHLDINAVEAYLKTSTDARIRWVATESYFSMDGDVPDLVVLRTLCDRYHAGTDRR